MLIERDLKDYISENPSDLTIQAKSNYESYSNFMKQMHSLSCGIKRNWKDLQNHFEDGQCCFFVYMYPLTERITKPIVLCWQVSTKIHCNLTGIPKWQK